MIRKERKCNTQRFSAVGWYGVANRLALGYADSTTATTKTWMLDRFATIGVDVDTARLRSHWCFATCAGCKGVEHCEFSRAHIHTLAPLATIGYTLVIDFGESHNAVVCAAWLLFQSALLWRASWAVEHLVVHLRCGLYRVFNELENTRPRRSGQLGVACRFYSIRQAGIIGKAAAYIAVAQADRLLCSSVCDRVLGAGITHKLGAADAQGR